MFKIKVHAKSKPSLASMANNANFNTGRRGGRNTTSSASFARATGQRTGGATGLNIGSGGNWGAGTSTVGGGRRQTYSVG